MKIVRVTYTTQPGYAAQNQQNIRQVMEDLQKINSPGIRYHVCLGADGKTFSHTAFFESENGEQTLFALASFKNFQEQLRASKPETPPKQELLTLVGSSSNLFN